MSDRSWPPEASDGADRATPGDDRAERLLRGHFRHVPPPRLSPFFDARLLSRARAAQARPVLAGRARRLLQAYWLLAAAVSLVLLGRTPWTATTDDIVAAAVSIFAVVAFPAWLLARPRGGLFALLLRMRD